MFDTCYFLTFHLTFALLIFQSVICLYLLIKNVYLKGLHHAGVSEVSLWRTKNSNLHCCSGTHCLHLYKNISKYSVYHFYAQLKIWLMHIMFRLSVFHPSDNSQYCPIISVFNWVYRKLFFHQSIWLSAIKLYDHFMILTSIMMNPEIQYYFDLHLVHFKEVYLVIRIYSWYFQ